jgi:hypothetical protein
MRGNITDILDDRGDVDIKLINERGLGHLLRRFKVRRTYDGSGKDKMPIDIVEVELHDAQAAAMKLAIMGLENWDIEITEKKRIAITVMIQKLLDDGLPRDSLGSDLLVSSPTFSGRLPQVHPELKNLAISPKEVDRLPEIDRP